MSLARKILGVLITLFTIVMSVIGVAPIFGWIGPSIIMVEEAKASIDANPLMGSGVSITYRGEYFPNITEYSFYISNSSFSDIDHVLPQTAIRLRFSESVKILEYRISAPDSVLGFNNSCILNGNYCDVNFNLFRAGDRIKFSLVISGFTLNNFKIISNIKDIKEVPIENITEYVKIENHAQYLILIAALLPLISTVYLRFTRITIIELKEASVSNKFSFLAICAFDYFYAYVAPCMPLLFTILIFLRNGIPPF
ncbi:MAG: hypothetical protein JHC88_03810 [Niveispirillum sp.]|nr:hypothetical protein [Niveispirillum sp.]